MTIESFHPTICWDHVELLQRARKPYVRDRALRALVKEVTRLREGDCVLDVGCGGGTVPRILSKIYGQRIQIVGLDAEQSLIEHGKTHWGRPDHIQLEHGDALNLPFLDHSFDVVMSFGLLEWLGESVDRGVAEMIRVVKPDGRILVLSMELSKYESHPFYPTRDRYHQEYLQALHIFGVPIEREGDWFQDLFSRAGVGTKIHQHVSEKRYRITESLLVDFERMLTVQRSSRYSQQVKDFFFQFMAALGWPRERFDATYDKAFNPNNLISFYHQHLGEDYVERSHIILLESDPIKKKVKPIT